MSRARRLALIALLALPVAAALPHVIPPAAVLPHALTGAAGGLWEVGLNADGKDAKKICLPDPTVLAQWEHRDARCTRVLISDQGNKARFHYTCANGGFGDSEMVMLTPRTLRVTTQGISDNYPFGYTLHARRVGECPAG